MLGLHGVGDGLGQILDGNFVFEVDDRAVLLDVRLALLPVLRHLDVIDDRAVFHRLRCDRDLVRGPPGFESVLLLLRQLVGLDLFVRRPNAWSDERENGTTRNQSNEHLHGMTPLEFTRTTETPYPGSSLLDAVSIVAWRYCARTNGPPGRIR